ncbi:MAG: hypothetical protein ABIF10_02795 [Candidatus Woesearchaeota archaeon]
MNHTKTSLCQINGWSCVGCCGHDFTTKEELAEAIRKNTAEYQDYSDKKDFMNRSEDLRECGICRNVVFFDDNHVGCPLHPEINSHDIREGYCEIEHLCETAKAFDSWPKDRQERFIGFIEKKNPDWYDYSLNIDNGKYLEEFGSSL